MNGYYTGKISSIDKQNGKVKVTFPQESDVVSSWLPLLAFEYNMPDIGDFVAVILDGNDNGICLGKIYSNGTITIKAKNVKIVQDEE